MIDERRASGEKKDDLLGILIRSEVYGHDDNLTIDEILTFFFAGQKTIGVSTANLIMYLAQPKYHAYRDKLNEEVETILAPLESSTSLVDDYTYDMAEEFEFMKMAYNESLRIEPSVEVTLASTFTADVVLGENKEYQKITGKGPVTIKKGECFFIAVRPLHHNP